MATSDYSESGSDYGASDDDFVEEAAAPAPKPKGKAAAAAAAKKAAPAATAAATKARRPAAKPRGKAAAAAKSAAVVDSDDDDAMDVDEPTSARPRSAGAAKTIEETYQKKTQLEHILLRPDTYIGSVEAIMQPMWVLNESLQFVHRTITYVPGLFKIFDEILVNAADNKIRDPNMDTLKVTIDAENNTISVMNNGRGIPVQIHKEEQVYVPELIFGHLLTSSNYDDGEKKVTGGRNGYGAKLCNIFSTEFTVETADRDAGKKYKQTFSANMGAKTNPAVSDNKRNEEYTKITFKPDLAKFGMTALDADIVSLLKKRVYDMAGCTRGVKVFLNGDRVKIKDFKSYVNLYIQSQLAQQRQDAEDDDAPAAAATTTTVVYESNSPRWEVAVAPADDQFSQMSFVNSICTSKGGTHVDHITSQVVAKLVEAVKKKVKGTPLRPAQVKNNLWVFVNCLIENPTFDSQTKENMTLRASAFGSKCALSDDFHKKVLKCGILDRLISVAEAKQGQQLKKTDGKKRNRITGIAKLDDANFAGTRQAAKCTLILTEGDSAKALAVSGLSVVGRDYYGVFPLRGKILNVRDAASHTVAKNEEVSAIKKILGLAQGKVYTSVADLRYGHLMIMTDQDHDGSHIKGLLINLFDQYWPSLLKIPGFLCEFITPIIKCTKKREQLTFYSMPEYDEWREAHDNVTRGWTIKYYKGLGTSTREEAKQYFSALPKHRKPFDPCDAEDRALVDMAFNKKKADDRKQWLTTYERGTYMDHSQPSIPVKEFINKELMLFSIADNKRSIPSVVDGLKPGQRKILFCCFKRNLKAEIKVAQLSGYVSEHSAYHHGEVSLSSTIVNMAQDYVGSNNIYLLEPRGQFGTRLRGGDDAASARYIFTTLAPITRRIFHPHDDALLEYLNDDGQSIEPEWYMPVLPLVLINGATGIGTGWSTAIPNHHPLDVVNNLRRLIKGEPVEPMKPWYHGFRGTIEPILNATGTFEGRYRIAGTMARPDDVTLEITELPVGTWTEKFKDMLETFLAGTEKEKACITDYREYHTDVTVHFIVTLTPDAAKMSDEELEKKFKLATTLSVSNMVCFDEHSRIKRYPSTSAILEDFFHLRLKYYAKRKEYLVDQLLRNFKRQENKVRFIREVIDRKLIIERKAKAALVAELRKRDFLPIKKGSDKSDKSSGSAAGGAGAGSGDGNEEDDDENVPASLTDYDYLLSMPLYTLTQEKIDQMEAELRAKKEELDFVLSQSPEDMWTTDLDAFVAEYDALEDARQKREAKQVKGKKPATLKAIAAAASSSTTAKKRAAPADDDDFEAKPAPAKRARAAPAKKPAAAAAAPKPKAKPKVKAESDGDDSDAGDDDAMDVVVVPKRERAPRRATTAKSAAIVELSSDSEADEPAGGDDEEEEVEVKPAPAAKGKAKAAVPKAAKPVKAEQPAAASSSGGKQAKIDDFFSFTAVTRKPPAAKLQDEGDDDDLETRLAKIRARASGGAAASKPSNSSPAASSSSTTAVAAAAKTADEPPKRRGRPPKAKAVISDDDDEVVVAAVKPAAAEPPKRRGRPPKAKVAVVSDSDDDDDEVVAAKPASPPRARPTRRAAAARPVATVTIEDSDSDEFEAGGGGGDDDDESDFDDE
ncbi:DNA topoisomerase 2 [Blastocladiella emersonii ATCC 22665]|nr:DNA topoisomerase 2 [Blastocladiella emersonii ATCC 22665]